MAEETFHIGYKPAFKMNKRKSLRLVCFILLLLLFEVGVYAGSSISEKNTPDGWPEQLDKRRLYSFKHAFIYAERKSEAAVVHKRIEKAIKELDKDNVKKNETIIGLALITDTEEKPLVDYQKIIDILREVHEQHQSEKTKKDLKSAIEAKEGIEKEGMDMDILMSIAPIPVEPNLLPEIINKFPKGVEEQVDFCVFVPTSRNIKYGFKKMFDFAIKKQKIGILERLALIPLMPFIVGKVVDGMKKSQQLIVYERLLEKQKHLSKEQREDKFKAYKKKLGLGDDDYDYGSKPDKKKIGQSK
jgi:hypothetical protein